MRPVHRLWVEKSRPGDGKAGVNACFSSVCKDAYDLYETAMLSPQQTFKAYFELEICKRFFLQ